jgi:hypothetical protein
MDIGFDQAGEGFIHYYVISLIIEMQVEFATLSRLLAIMAKSR